MDGKSHKAFAPVFTFGASALLVGSGIVPGDPTTVILVSTISSLVTSNSADADLHAYKPMYVIWDTKPWKKVNGKYRVNIRGKGPKTYTVPRGMDMKIWATLFKMVGVTKHRDWRSHSPSLWVPLAILFYMGVAKIAGVLPGQLATLLPAVALGLGLGYISHIVADASNKGGIPMFFTNKQTSITKKLFGDKISNLFRSSNKKMNRFITILFAIGGLTIVFPGVMIPINKSVIGLAGTMIKGIFGMIRGIAGI